MARGRIFSSRRMFSTRRDAFAEPSSNAGPLGVVLGVVAAGIIIFVIGVYVGASFPSIFGMTSAAPTPASVPAPVTSDAPEMEAPVVTFAPEPEPVPDTGPEAAPEPTLAPEGQAPAPAPASGPTSVAPLAPTAPAPASSPTPAPTRP